jgi:hypothetical protein
VSRSRRDSREQGAKRVCVLGAGVEFERSSERASRCVALALALEGDAETRPRLGRQGVDA